MIEALLVLVILLLAANVWLLFDLSRSMRVFMAPPSVTWPPLADAPQGGNVVLSEDDELWSRLRSREVDIDRG